MHLHTLAEGCKFPNPRFLVFERTKSLRRWRTKTIIRNPCFGLLLSSSGIPHWTARCSWPIGAINVGPGGQPEDVFEGILEDVLERPVATQMPEDSSTGNFQLKFGRSPLFLLGLLLYDCNTCKIDFVFALGWGCKGDLRYNFGLIQTGV